MKFNMEQQQQIYEFIMKYNSDENFKDKVEELYFENPGMLSILEIYALEEIIQFGNNGIYKSLLELQENNVEETTFEDINTFLHLFNEDENFRNLKIQQFTENPESLSKLEIFAMTVIIKAQLEPEDLHEKLTDNLEYDELNPIKYSTDEEITETLTNLLFGQFIHQVLELPEMEPIKVRQKQSGMIANIDKPIIIDAVSKVIPGTLEQVNQIVEQRFVSVKFNILLGKKEEAFSQYSMYNTNVSSKEIFKELLRPRQK